MRGAILALTAIWVLSEPAWSEQSHGKENDQAIVSQAKQTETNETAANPTKKLPAVATPPVSQGIAEQRASKQLQNTQRENSSETLGHIYGFFAEEWDKVLASIFSALLACFTYLLWRSTNNLWTETRNAGRVALRSARAAENATKTSQVIEQAIIYAFPGGQYAAGGKDPAGMTMNFGNCGKTVAHLEKVSYGAIKFNGDDPWKMPDHFPRVVVMRHIVPANTPPIVARLPFDFDSDTIAFYGRVHFRDVFGKKWHTTWAYRLERSEGWAAYPFDPNAQLHQDNGKE